MKIDLDLNLLTIKELKAIINIIERTQGLEKEVEMTVNKNSTNFMVQDLRYIIREYKKGTSNRDIAKAVGRTEGSIGTILSRLKARRQMTKRMKAAMKAEGFKEIP